ncbi:MAG TPA: hypothetical protein VG245_11315 [Candidatus Dormibacteraeota bacterium]|jgi:hypothetical protein|nr:hypothetical protein [Candidatus Dormibacteraeota bacterium]
MSKSTKLSLHRETVRELTGESLAQIAAGALTPVVNTIPLGNCFSPFMSASSCCPAADGGCSGASNCGAAC